MLKTTALAILLSFTAAAAGCIDQDDSKEPRKADSDDPDQDEQDPTDDDGLPAGCRVSLQGEDDPDCVPTP